MSPVYKYAIVAVVAVSAVAVAYQKGLSAGTDSERSRWLERQSEWFAEAAELSKQISDRRREHDIIVAKIEENHLNEVKKIEHSKNSIIADYRAGNLKLRQRFERQAACPANRDTTPSTAGNAESGAGFLSTDAEFLIQFAGRCDSTAKQLIAAQDYIRSLGALR